jgi:hypothetical protein
MTAARLRVGGEEGLGLVEAGYPGEQVEIVGKPLHSVSFVAGPN